MFQLISIEDSVHILPNLLRIPFHDAVLQVLNKTYSNKVVEGLGLCIHIFDIKSIQDPIVHPGDGGCFVNAEFRLVVFRPFVGEVIQGVIRSCSEEGVHVTLGFFDDVLVPPSCLPSTSRFDKEDQTWIWNYDDNDLPMEVGDTVKCRVISETFVDIHPKEFQKKVEGEVTYEKTISPYSITCTMSESGLGVLSWWDTEDADEDEE